MSTKIHKAAVGLGNPGCRYQRTRHNLGFLVIDCWLDRSRRKPERIESETASLYGHDDILLAKPTTYMNRSGLATQQILERFNLTPEQCLVVYDDYALPFGILRARARGGSGGHHGMESIIVELGTEEIPRLRLGIATGSTLEDLTDYVLGEFTFEEEKLLDVFLSRAADAVDCFFRHDIQEVIKRFPG